MLFLCLLRRVFRLLRGRTRLNKQLDFVLALLLLRTTDGPTLPSILLLKYFTPSYHFSTVGLGRKNLQKAEIYDAPVFTNGGIENDFGVHHDTAWS